MLPDGPGLLFEIGAAHHHLHPNRFAHNSRAVTRTLAAIVAKLDIFYGKAIIGSPQG